VSEWSDKFEDTKGVIRSYESKKDSQYNYRTKMVNNINNDVQITKQKTKTIEQHEHHKKKQFLLH
jgi:sensor domain CHASE-containing protein